MLAWKGDLKYQPIQRATITKEQMIQALKMKEQLKKEMMEEITAFAGDTKEYGRFRVLREQKLVDETAKQTGVE